MGIDFDLVGAEIEKLSAVVTILDVEETRKKWIRIAEKYGRDKVYEFQFWDELDESEIFCVENGWIVIKEFIEHKYDVYLFFELEDESKAFLFRNGDQLAEVLIESGVRDFYLLDENMTYLVCYNDSDAILAEGSAKEWLSQVKLKAAPR